MRRCIEKCRKSKVEANISLIGGINMFSIWRRDAAQTVLMTSVSDIFRDPAVEWQLFSISWYLKT